MTDYLEGSRVWASVCIGRPFVPVIKDNLSLDPDHYVSQISNISGQGYNS